MNHQDVVQRIKDQSPDLFTSLEGMLQFVLRVLAALPREERAGLVRSKPGAENTANYNGQPVRVNRVIYPNGEMVKILTDSGPTPQSANGPAWNLEAEREPDLYVPVDLPDRKPDEPNEPDGVPPVLEELAAAVKALHDAVIQQQEVIEAIKVRVMLIPTTAPDYTNRYIGAIKKA